MTQEILNALDHVRKVVDEKIDTVIFFKDGSWCYMIQETWEIPSFNDYVNDSILNDAVDSINELPAIFQL